MKLIISLFLWTTVSFGLFFTPVCKANDDSGINYQWFGIGLLVGITLSVLTVFYLFRITIRQYKKKDEDKELSVCKKVEILEGNNNINLDLDALITGSNSC